MSEWLIVIGGGCVFVGIVFVDLKMNLEAWRKSKELKRLSEGDTKKLYK